MHVRIHPCIQSFRPEPYDCHMSWLLGAKDTKLKNLYLESTASQGIAITNIKEENNDKGTFIFSIIFLFAKNDDATMVKPAGT